MLASVRAALGTIAAVFLVSCGGAPETGPRLPLDRLVEELQQGGYVLFLRHTATGARDDQVPVDLEDCRTQRLLSAAGRMQARTIGRAFRALRIPVGAVLTSRYCRTRETALLAFGRKRDVEVLTGLPSVYANRPRRIAAVRRLLGRRPAPGTNTVLVGHVVSIEPAAGIGLGAGEIGVFRPLGGERFELVGRVPVSVWPQLLGRVDSTALRASRSNGF